MQQSLMPLTSCRWGGCPICLCQLLLWLAILMSLRYAIKESNPTPPYQALGQSAALPLPPSLVGEVAFTLAVNSSVFCLHTCHCRTQILNGEAVIQSKRSFISDANSQKDSLVRKSDESGETQVGSRSRTELRQRRPRTSPVPVGHAFQGALYPSFVLTLLSSPFPHPSLRLPFSILFCVLIFIKVY